MNAMDVIEMKEALSNIAEIMRHYYLELVQGGFTEDQAFELTINYQNGLQNPRNAA